MLAIMLVAVMLDRPAITLRNVALAAFVILIVAPESLLPRASRCRSRRPSRWSPATRRSLPGAIGGWRLTIAPPAAWAAGCGDRVGSLLLTSTIAGLATAPFAAFHFQRVAPLTLIANLAAMPVVGIIVMPMALPRRRADALRAGSVAADRDGLGARLGDRGREADRCVVVRLRRHRGDAGPGAGLVVAGFLWLALWRERWRLAGLVPMLAAVPIALTAPRPDILIDERGVTVAVRGGDGRLAIVDGKGASFEVENWLRADGDPRAADDPDVARRCRLRSAGLRGPVRAGRRPRRGRATSAALEEDCRMAAVVISRFAAPDGCRDAAIVIDRRDVSHGMARTRFTATGWTSPAGRRFA